MAEPLALLLCIKAPARKQLAAYARGALGISPGAWLSIAVLVGIIGEMSAGVKMWACESCQIRVWAEHGKVFLRAVPKGVVPGYGKRGACEYSISEHTTLDEAKRAAGKFIADFSIKNPRYD